MELKSRNLPAQSRDDCTLPITIVARAKIRPLWDAAKRVGTQARLAQELCVALGTVQSWISCRAKPGHRKMSDPDFVTNFLHVTGSLPCDVWPENVTNEMLRVVGTQREYKGSLTVDQIESLSDTMATVECQQEQNVIDAQCSVAIGRSMEKRLTTRERNVLLDYFGLEGRDSMTLEEIGNQESQGYVTIERIRQIHTKALGKMRRDRVLGKGRLTLEEKEV